MSELKQMFTESQNSSFIEKQASLDDKDNKNETEITKAEDNSNNHESEQQKPLITPRTTKIDYSAYDNALRSDMSLRNFLKNVRFR